MHIEELDDEGLSALYPRPEKPWLRANFVSSVDGAVAVDGRSAGLSGAADKRVFRLLRMKCDALLVGAGTFRAERYLPLNAPRRLVVVSDSLRLDPAHPALAGAMVLTTNGVGNPALERVAEVVRCDNMTHGIALLHARGLRQILCEGGPRLFGALTLSNLVDELCLTISPLLVGPGSGRIVSGTPHALRRMRLAHSVTSDEGALMLRYVAAR